MGREGMFQNSLVDKQSIASMDTYVFMVLIRFYERVNACAPLSQFAFIASFLNDAYKCRTKFFLELE